MVMFYGGKVAGRCIGEALETGKIERRLLQRRSGSAGYLFSSLKKVKNIDRSVGSQVSDEVDGFDGKKMSEIEKMLIRPPIEQLMTPKRLNQFFLAPEYLIPTRGQISQSQEFFNQCHVKYEWSTGRYQDLPDVRSQGTSDGRIPQIVQDFGEGPLNFEAKSGVFGNSPKNVLPNFGLWKPLPEVLLIGHTNAGKSSLINNLLVDRQENKSDNSKTEHAFVSKKAGYTETLNCFNIGNKVRLIDSPGYGKFGVEEQGKLVVEYISNRKYLRKVFVLVDSLEKVKEEDIELISFLVDVGVSFDLIFTKVDEVIKRCIVNVTSDTRAKLKCQRIEEISVKDLRSEFIESCNNKITSYFLGIVSLSKLDEVSTLPKMFFSNSLINKYVARRYSYKDIRFEILQSCGLI